MIVIVNSSNNIFSFPKEETVIMHKAFKELIKKYNLMFNDNYFIRRCKITNKGIELK